MIEEVELCSHNVLTFGSGGYYVICLECMCYWKVLDDDPRACSGKVRFVEDLRIKENWTTPYRSL